MCVEKVRLMCGRVGLVAVSELAGVGGNGVAGAGGGAVEKGFGARGCWAGVAGGGGGWGRGGGRGDGGWANGACKYVPGRERIVQDGIWMGGFCGGCWVVGGECRELVSKAG